LKLIKLSIAGKKNNNIDVLNLLSNDGRRIENSPVFTIFVLVGPLAITIVVIILAVQVNVSILGGLLVLLIAIPTQILLNALLAKFR
jgi:hypothetical protein